MITTQPTQSAQKQQAPSLLANFIQRETLKLKPSKSSANLTEQEYDKYFKYHPKSTARRYLDKFVPPIDYKIVAYCAIWYALSGISSNISKEILGQFPYPTAFTELQFMCSVMFCMLMMLVLTKYPGMADCFPKGTLPSKSKAISLWKLIEPSKLVINTTLPMGMFQFIGHITTHMATHVIPVSLVHSVKALSPITTVLVYKLFFHKSYSKITYVTLVPLVCGVMMTCLSNKSRESDIFGFYKGLVLAFISMIIFVSQNVYAKKILTVKESSLPVNKDEGEEQIIDKLNILLYCSIFGFLLTLPIYLINEITHRKICLFEINMSVITLILLHGISHFFQAMIAFHLIGLISPVNYSIANIMKRIVVISMAMIWESSSINGVQGAGLLLTLIGLYSYDRWGMKK